MKNLTARRRSEREQTQASLHPDRASHSCDTTLGGTGRGHRQNTMNTMNTKMASMETGRGHWRRTAYPVGSDRWRRDETGQNTGVMCRYCENGLDLALPMPRRLRSVSMPAMRRDRWEAGRDSTRCAKIASFSQRCMEYDISYKYLTPYGLLESTFCVAYFPLPPPLPCLAWRTCNVHGLRAAQRNGAFAHDGMRYLQDDKTGCTLQYCKVISRRAMCSLLSQGPLVESSLASSACPAARAS